MHGCCENNRKRRIRRMLSCPSSVNSNSRGVIAAVVVDDDSDDAFRRGSLVKDVRKINIGDCALFKPPQESPPFIGIIRSLGSDKKNLQLGVNWLYRPADVQNLKGVAVDAAPNEVFYSFHRDEIPAASLLHPCKVAFLRKGVELPSGVSSFVCRRVYDTTNKRLWWLTDKDYINGRQEEVNQLLDKTQFEMHATAQQQQGGRSPKPVNSPVSASQLKRSPDSVQNSTSSVPTHSKSKKRERSDQSSEPIKRVRSIKSDDGDSNALSSDFFLKSEIAKITEKGGLLDSEAADRLVQLMQPDKLDRRRDIACRLLLVGVVAATKKDDCLNRFVQLRGLPILDEWIQEVHKGKVGDSSSPKDHDKSVDDFLLTLLRALDRLPVNLNALQMCNIGKSVNQLRSHRNSDIQRKAKTLVDTWKKRVEAEMNTYDTRPTNQDVSWTPRTRNEGAFSGTRHTSASGAATKNSPSQLSSSKSAPAKSFQGDAVKSVSPTPVSVKLPTSPSSMSANMKDVHHSTSVVCGSSEHPLSAIKDEKSSSCSPSHSNSYCSSDHIKNVGPSVKEEARCSNSGSTSLSRSSGSGSRHKKSVNGLQSVSADHGEVKSNKKSKLRRISVSEKISQPISEKACEVPVAESTNKIIVKLSNRGRSPAQKVNGGPTEDLLVMNSRVASPLAPEKHDHSERASIEETDNLNNARSDANTELRHSNNLKVEEPACDDDDKSSAAALDSRRSQIGDEAGNLCNIGKIASPFVDDLKSRYLQDSSLSSINALIESCVKHSEANVEVSAGDVVGMNLLASVAAGEISKPDSPIHSPQKSSSVAEDHKVRPKSNGDVQLPSGESIQAIATSNGEDQKKNISSGSEVANVVCESVPAVKEEGYTTSLATELKICDRPLKQDNLARPVEGNEVSSVPLGDHENSDVKKKKKNKGVIQRAPSKTKGTESLVKIEKNAVSCINNLLPGQFNDFREDDPDAVSGCNSHYNDEPDQKVKPEKDALPPLNKKEESIPESSSSDQNTKGNAIECSASQSKSVSPVHDNKLLSDSKECKPPACDGEDVKGERPSAESDPGPVVGKPVSVEKLGFDLNEGFDVDDSKDGDVPSAVKHVDHLPSYSVASATVSLPASVTVTAAAKGPFKPPEDRMKIKGELRWKGSAATSAFRPAEPRKVSDIPSGPSNANVCDVKNGKQNRARLEIDLNVADESSMEEMDCQFNDPQVSNRFGVNSGPIGSTSGRNAGFFGLDLNKADEAPDLGRVDMPFQLTREVTPSSALSNSDSGRRNFDLNNGPAADEVTVDSTSCNPHTRANIPSQPSLGFRINGAEIGNLNPWYAAGSTFSPIPIPSPISSRDQPFSLSGAGGDPTRMFGGPVGSMPFNVDMYRGSVLSSSPAVPYHGAPYQYPVFPFHTSFPLPSSSLPGGSTTFMDLSSGGRVCIPTVASQFVGSAPNVPPYTRPYKVSLSDVENTRQGGRQGLDLNSGPGGVDLEGRAETLSIQARPGSNMGSLTLTEEQARMYAMAGGIMKRKEPEGGRDTDRLSYNQPSWH